MDWKKEGKILLILGLVFLGFYFLPIGEHRFDNAIFEALYLAKWYAREHVIFCLIPAFFIAGAIGVFISQQSVMKYLGAKANKVNDSDHSTRGSMLMVLHQFLVAYWLYVLALFCHYLRVFTKWVPVLVPLLRFYIQVLQ